MKLSCEFSFKSQGKLFVRGNKDWKREYEFIFFNIREIRAFVVTPKGKIY